MRRPTEPTTIRINAARCEIALIVTPPRKQLCDLYTQCGFFILASSVAEKFQRETKFVEISTDLPLKPFFTDKQILLSFDDKIQLTLENKKHIPSSILK